METNTALELLKVEESKNPKKQEKKLEIKEQPIKKKK